MLAKYAEALPVLTKSIDIEPGDQAYQNRGWAYEAMDLSEAALRDYNAALELTPDDKWTLCHKGRVLHSLGRESEAQAGRSFCTSAERY